MTTFEWPWMLLLLPLPLVVRRLVPAAATTRRGALRVPFYDAVASLGEGSARTSRRRTSLLAAMMLAWLALLLAAARPAWVGDPVPLPAEGRDLMLAIDLSGSMARADFTVGGQQADRLTVVKDVARDFIGRREGDRVGLVLFGTRPYLQAPLTFDRATVQTLLDEAQVGIAGDETAIGDALGMAVKRLRDRPAQSRVLVLLTDGASNTGALDPLEAAKLARDEGIRVYTIGVGADAVAVPSLFGQQIVNPSADLDERTLSRIAQITGGEYFRAKNVEGLDAIYHVIDQLEPATAEPLFLRPRHELFQWPLGVALALSMLVGAGTLAPSLVSFGRTATEVSA
jgi:Ca-activated chloride channel homolog